MPLDTIPTPILPDDAALYLTRLDERGEAYEFQVVATPMAGRGKLGPIKLVLFREGVEDPLTLTLDMTGRWSAHHVLVVGEN